MFKRYAQEAVDNGTPLIILAKKAVLEGVPQIREAALKYVEDSNTYKNCLGDVDSKDLPLLAVQSVDEGRDLGARKYLEDSDEFMKALEENCGVVF